MIADAQKLACKICEAYVCREYSERYRVKNCCPDLEAKDSIYLWVLNSSCTIPRSLECIIENYLDNKKYDDPVTTDVQNCSITQTDSTAALPSCTNSLSISIVA